MASFKTKFVEKKEVADQTWSFSFKKPSDFNYKAGQYINLKLIHPTQTDSKGDVRSFSISNAPYESNITITTRITDSAFKHNLMNMPYDTEVEVMGPMGTFTLNKEESRNIACLAGGIGITPFRSMILDAVHNSSNLKLYLFYANHSIKEAAFYDEFKNISEDKGFTFIPIMTEQPDWEGEKEHINEQMLKKYIPDLTNTIFYTAGPQKMVDSLKGLLTDISIHKDSIIFEVFPGY